MKKQKESKHDIYLSDEGDCNRKVVIKGNNLNLQWINDAILVWSDRNITIQTIKINKKNRG